MIYILFGIYIIYAMFHYMLEDRVAKLEEVLDIQSDDESDVEDDSDEDSDSDE
jgi:hypothetical protein